MVAVVHVEHSCDEIMTIDCSFNWQYIVMWLERRHSVVFAVVGAVRAAVECCRLQPLLRVGRRQQSRFRQKSANLRDDTFVVSIAEETHQSVLGRLLSYIPTKQAPHNSAWLL